MKAKNILVSLLAASPLILTACSDNNAVLSENATGSGRLSVPAPGTNGGSTKISASSFFNGLRKSEAILNQKYQFSSKIVGRDLEFSDLEKIYPDGIYRGLTHLEVLAGFRRQSVTSVKLSFFDDIYIFSQNYQNLVLREKELRGYNSQLFENYAKKLQTLGETFIVKRASFYSDLLERQEENLYRVGVENINIISRGSLDINLPGVNSRQFNRKRRKTIVNAIKSAKSVCNSLDSMVNDRYFGNELQNKNILTCDSSSISRLVSNLRDIDKMSKDQISTAVNTAALSRLKTLNTIANAYLEENSISLDNSRNSGINNRLRQAWELSIVRNNPGKNKEMLEQAMDNNMYNNLLFKIRVVEGLKTLSPRINRDLQNELSASRKAFSRINYRDINTIVGSSAVNNGIGSLPSPDVIISPDNDQITAPVALDPAPIVLQPSNPPASSNPNTIVAPENNDTEEKQPPTPPRTIRRPS